LDGFRGSAKPHRVLDFRSFALLGGWSWMTFSLKAAASRTQSKTLARICGGHV
jgi:hypothetical protein